MEVVMPYAMTAAIAAGALIILFAVSWLAFRRPNAYRRLFIWIILLPQVSALGFAIWNEGLRQARSVVNARAKGPDRDTIVQLIDAKLVPEWMILAVPLTVVCVALLLSLLPELVKEEGRVTTRRAD